MLFLSSLWPLTSLSCLPQQPRWARRHSSCLWLVRSSPKRLVSLQMLQMDTLFMLGENQVAASCRAFSSPIASMTCQRKIHFTRGCSLMKWLLRVNVLQVPPRAEEITIPADVTPEKVPTHIVDYSGSLTWWLECITCIMQPPNKSLCSSLLKPQMMHVARK